MQISAVTKEYCDWMKYGRDDKPSTPQTLDTIAKTMRLIQKVISDCEVEEINEEKVMLLKRTMIDRNNSDNYRSRVFTWLRGFLKYCKEQRKMNVLDFTKVKPPKRQKKIAEYFTIEEVAKILDSMPRTVQGVRNKALICILLSSGMRISEALSLNRDSIIFESERAVITGKGRKEGVVFFHPWAIQAVKNYVEIRKDGDQALFVNHSTDGVGRMTPDNVKRYFNRLSKKLGMHIHAHKFRKTYATHFQHGGGDLYDLQNLLRHSKITTTQVYVGVDYDRLQYLHQNFVQYGVAQEIAVTPIILPWAGKAGWDRCRGCGESEKKHAAHGYCYKCLMRNRNSVDSVCATA